MGRLGDVLAGIGPGGADQDALAVARPLQHVVGDADVVAALGHRMVRAVFDQVRIAVQDAVDVDVVAQERHGGRGNHGVGRRRRTAGKQDRHAVNVRFQIAAAAIGCCSWNAPSMSVVSCQLVSCQVDQCVSCHAISAAANRSLPSIPNPSISQLGHVRSMNVVSTCDSLKAVWSRIFWCRGMVVFTPSMCNSLKRPLHAGDGLAAGRLVDDQLADHRIVVRRDDVAFVDVRIEPHAEPAGHAKLA